MVTLNNIMDALKAFGTANVFIQHYATGQASDMDKLKESQFPLMFTLYEGSTYNTNVKSYSFEIVLVGNTSQLDQVDESVQMVSDMEQVAEDLLADILVGHTYFAFGEQYEMTSASVSPLVEQERNILTGCALRITIDVPYNANSCIQP